MRRRISSRLVLFGLFCVVMGCGSGGGGDGDSGGQCVTISGNGTSGTTVSIVSQTACDSAYSPPILIVTAGTTVTWTNNDGVDHTVTSSSGCACSRGDALPVAERELDSPTINPGNSFPHQFDTPGTFDYVCTIQGHAMRGRVIVQ